MTRTNALTKETFGKSGAPRALKKEGNKKIKPTMASNTKTEEKIHHFEAKITCPSNRDALVLKNSLSVDPELNPTKVDRSIEVEDKVLVIRLDATEVCLLRPAVSTLLDLATAAAKAIEAFG